VPKKLDLPTTKRTLNFFEGDCETLADYYPTLGWSAAVRQLVHIHAKKLRERASRSGAQSNERAELAELATDIDLDLGPADAIPDGEPVG
jgi:hypothetical protein